MSVAPSTPQPLAASYLEAAATAVQIGVGYVPPALASLVRDAKAASLTSGAAQIVDRVDAVWRLVEDAWDCALPAGTPNLFYEIWSDRFARAAPGWSTERRERRTGPPARGRASETIAAAQIGACLLPVFRPSGSPSTLHDLIVEVEHGQHVSVQVRTLAQRKDRPTYEGSVVTPKGVGSTVFVFVPLELPVCFVVPANDIPVTRRVSWQPPALRLRSRRRDALNLDRYFMAFENLWSHTEPAERFEDHRPYLDEVQRRAYRVVYGR